MKPLFTEIEKQQYRELWELLNPTKRWRGAWRGKLPLITAAERSRKVKAKWCKWECKNPGYKAKWRARSPDKVKANNARARKKMLVNDPLYASKAGKRWRADNPGRSAEDFRMWRLENPEAYRAHYMNCASKKSEDRAATRTFKLLHAASSVQKFNQAAAGESPAVSGGSRKRPRGSGGSRKDPH